ncbi:MAG TPA: hypothetical protein PK297_07085 [Spirochaetota bacterium]|nr:hypothetical protein [Spirochaetota bacterium]
MGRIADIVKKWIDPGDLAFDLMVAAFPTLFFGVLVPPGGGYSAVLLPEGFLVVTSAVSLVVTIYMGQIYRRFLESSESGFARGLLKTVFFLGITSCYLVPLLVFAAFRLEPFPELGETGRMLIFLVPAWPIFWGIYAGFPRENHPELRYVLYVPGVMAAVIAIPTAIGIGTLAGWLAGLLSFIMMILLLFATIPIRIMIDSRANSSIAEFVQRRREQSSEERRLISYEDIAQPLWFTVFLRRLVLPVSAAAALLVWQIMLVEILERVYANWRMSPDADFIFVSMFVSGIVPLRIAAWCSPPWKPLTLLTAGVSIWVYLDALSRFVGR